MTYRHIMNNQFLFPHSLKSCFTPQMLVLLVDWRGINIFSMFMESLRASTWCYISTEMCSWEEEQTTQSSKWGRIFMPNGIRGTEPQCQCESEQVNFVRTQKRTVHWFYGRASWTTHTGISFCFILLNPKHFKREKTIKSRIRLNPLILFFQNKYKILNFSPLHAQYSENVKLVYRKHGSKLQNVKYKSMCSQSTVIIKHSFANLNKNCIISPKNNGLSLI